MKKYLLFLLIFSANLVFSFSQAIEIEEDKTEVLSPVVSNEQYETFYWKPVASARRYNLQIQKLNSNNEWEMYKTFSTMENSIEATFFPGHYRASIISINALGKKSNPSEWIGFRVLEEFEPYLFENSFHKNSDWNSPVIKLNPSETDTGDYIKAEDGFENNSFFVKGRNIFSPHTKFTLIPINSSLSGGKPYTVFDTSRQPVELEIIKRDTQKSGVYLLYDEQSLKPGYYSLEARNPGNFTSEISLLVLKDEKLIFSPENLEIDSRYLLRTVSKDENQNKISLQFTASGITKETDFYIEGSNGVFSYPFETLTSKKDLNVSISEIQQIPETENFTVTIDINAADLKSGYYNFTAQQGDQSESFKFLVTEPFESKPKESIQSVSSKYIKKNKTVRVTVKGENLDPSKKYAIVSAFDTDAQKNKKCFPDFSYHPKDKNKMIAEIPVENISFGKNVLIVEDDNYSAAFYFNIDKRFRSKIINNADETILADFHRPAINSDDSDIKITEKDIQEENFTYISYEENLSDYYPIHPRFFPFIRINGAGLFSEKEVFSGGNMDLRVEADVFNNGKFYFNPAIKYNPGYIYINDESYEVYPKLGLELNGNYVLNENWTYFKPFVGLGLGFNLIDNVKDRDYSGNDLYVGAHFGASLFEFFDFKYSFEIHNMYNIPEMYFANRFTIGIRLPIRPVTYERDVLYYDAYVNIKDTISDEQWSSLNSDTLSITFAGNPTKLPPLPDDIEYVLIPASIKVLEKDYFSEKRNLYNVETHQAKFEKIESGAFKNCKAIRLLYLPETVTCIEEDAFEGWTNGQTIMLGWPSTDSTERNLDGLKNIAPFIYYSDEILFQTKNESEVFYFESSKLKIIEYEDDEGYTEYARGLPMYAHLAPNLNEFNKGDILEFTVIGCDGSHDIHFDYITNTFIRCSKPIKPKKGKKCVIRIPFRKNKHEGKILDLNDLREVSITGPYRYSAVITDCKIIDSSSSKHKKDITTENK